MTNDRIEVRRATMEDHEAVTGYAMKIVRQHQSFNAVRFVAYRDHEQKLADYFLVQINHPEAIVLVAQINNQVVGYSFTRIEQGNLIDISPKAAWLHDIYLDESARGTGAGKMLLNASLEAAKALHTSTIMLIVAPQNEFARALFERNGFKVSAYEMQLNIGE